jgi:hypothetical protein
MSEAEPTVIPNPITHPDAFLTWLTNAVSSMTHTQDENAALHATIASLQARLAMPAVPVQAPAPRIKMNPPDTFSGSRSQCATFLAQLDLVFQASDPPYSEAAKILYMNSFLRGSAFTWYTTMILNATPKPVFHTYNDYLVGFRGTFAEDSQLMRVSSRETLQSIKQKSSCEAYATLFLATSAHSGYDDENLRFLFERGLKMDIRRFLLAAPKPTSLADLIQLASSYDMQLFALSKHSLPTHPPIIPTRPTIVPAVPTQSTTTDMEVDAATLRTSTPRGPLDQAERDRRRTLNLCRYCGRDGCPGAPDVLLCPLRKQPKNGHSRAPLQ